MPRSSEAIPRAALIAAGAFSEQLSAASVVAAIERGLRAAGHEEVDRCPLEYAEAVRGQPLAGLLAAVDFDARMRAARALVIAAARLERTTLEKSAAFELATRARQAGVPCYAVTAENRLSEFDARMLDLQLIVEARDARGMAAAGRELARVL